MKILLKQAEFHRIYVDSDNFLKPNYGGSGKTLKELVLADPDKTGYTKDYLDKLQKAGVLTLAESNGAKQKASK